MKEFMVIPCICIEHRPTVADSLLYGMPQITIANNARYSQRYSAYCPCCGRGTRLASYKSADAAVRNWNSIQRFSWQLELYNLPHKQVPKWKFEYWEEMRKCWGGSNLPRFKEENK